MEYGKLKLGEVLAVRLDKGDDLLARLEEVIKKENIKQGVILSGIGTLDVCCMYQGHVEPGTKIQIIGEIFIARLTGARLTKEPYSGPEKGPNLLKVKPE